MKIGNFNTAKTKQLNNSQPLRDKVKETKEIRAGREYLARVLDVRG